MKLLVTGCTGFLGASIGRMAASNGFEVLGIGRSNQPAAGWPGKYFQKDLACSDISTIIETFMPDVFFHAAGPASVSESFIAPIDDFQASLLTWVNALDSIRRSNLRPLVLFPSSAAVYGNPLVLPVREDAVIAPISPYGFHKAACELIAREYSECFGLDITVCRFFTIFGAAQRRLLIWDLFQQFAGPEQTVWLQGGTESRDYFDIDDAGGILIRIICQNLNSQNKDCQQGRYRVVNIASGEQIKVLDVARQIRELVAPAKDVRCREQKMVGHPDHWCADISLLRSLVPNWQPKPFSRALSRCVAVWREKQVPIVG